MPLYKISGRGVIPELLVGRWHPPWDGFCGSVGLCSSSRYVFLGPQVSRLLCASSFFPYIYRFLFFPVGRWCRQDGGMGVLGLGIFQFGVLAYMLALVQ